MQTPPVPASQITGKPIFPHSYTLYISGTTPITLSNDTTYNTIIQTDANNITVTLPYAQTIVDGTNMLISAAIGGSITVLTHSIGETIEGLASVTVASGGSCLLVSQKAAGIWNIIFNDGSGSIPVPFASQIVFVNQAGNDSTGNGSVLYPYKTITHAMSTITDALYEKRYTICLGPGNYAENFSWKAWVFMIGQSNMVARLTGNVDINDPSWAVPGTHNDERAGAQNITFAGNVTIDFNAIQSPYGKFYFWNCNSNNTVNATGYHPVNQIYISQGQWFGGINYTGINLTLASPIFFSGPIVCGPSTVDAAFTGVGGTLQGDLTLNSNGTTNIIGGALIDFPISGNIIINGSNTTLDATNSSLPLQASITILNGAILTRLTDAYSLAYTPSTPANWNGNPTSLTNAIDRIASLLRTLNGGTPIP